MVRAAAGFGMTCPNHNGPLCTTCRLGGLIRCPVMGVPLPLVEGERLGVYRDRIGQIVESKRNGGTYSAADKDAILRYLKDKGIFE